MAARREITKKLAREYAGASRTGKGEVLDTLVATTGWTRDHARRAIRHASSGSGQPVTGNAGHGRGSTPTTLCRAAGGLAARRAAVGEGT